MYAKLEEVTIIHKAKYRPQEGDRPIFERGLNMDRVFTFDPTPSQYDSAAPKRYGIGYIGPNEDVCIVPDVWDENDSWIARRAERPAWLTYTVNWHNGDAVVDKGSVYVKVGEHSPRYNPFDAIEVNGEMFAKNADFVIKAGPVASENDLPPYGDIVREIMYDWRVRDLEGRWYIVADPNWQPEG